MPRSRRAVLGLVLAATVLAWGCAPPTKTKAPSAKPVDLFSHVDPIIGTGGTGFGVGSTYPGPALPFALAHPGPDTRAPGGAVGFAHCSGYWYPDPEIAGFSLTRMNGTGVPDYGNLAFMPVDGITADDRFASGYAEAFSHGKETASPGYYRVTLANGIEVELSSTLHDAIFRITFPKGVDPVVLLDAAHALGEGKVGGGGVTFDNARTSGTAWVDDEGSLSDYPGGFDVHAAFAVDPAPDSVGVWDKHGLDPGGHAVTTVDGEPVGGWMHFPKGTHTVRIRVGVSFVDFEGAQNNLKTEMPGFDLDAVRAAAEKTWKKVFSHFDVYGVDDARATEIATAIYHAMLMPTLMSDVDGRAMGLDGSPEHLKHRRYSDLSLWDTYRTLHPWLLLTEDSHDADFAASLMDFAREGGALPRWALANGDTHSMVGDPGALVLAQMAADGVKLDQATAYADARVTAFGKAPGAIGGRSDITAYIAHGYVPADADSGSVSRTLEYAAADMALSDWAKRLGKTDDATTLADRAKAAARDLFNPKTGFFQPKNADGSWVPLPNPLLQGGPYTEGSAWQYLWMLPNQPDELETLLDGNTAALTRLDQFFAESEAEPGSAFGIRQWYWHGNEPCMVDAWLYAIWGEPMKEAKTIDWIVKTFYSTEPDGLAGNDDGGTMSAWLLFAMAGLYPVPGTSTYWIGVPRVPKMVIHRPSGDLTIEATKGAVTLDGSAWMTTLDGHELPQATITQAQLRGTHTLQVDVYTPKG